MLESVSLPLGAVDGISYFIVVRPVRLSYFEHMASTSSDYHLSTMSTELPSYMVPRCMGFHAQRIDHQTNFISSSKQQFSRRFHFAIDQTLKSGVLK